ncbi:MAG: MASE1 domain-containing protein [Oligoflexales bacterium]
MSRHRLVCFAMVLFIAVEVGRSLPYQDHYFAIVRPAKGIYTGFFFIEAFARWWLIGLIGFAIAVFSNLVLHNAEVVPTLLFAFISVSTSALAAYLLRALPQIRKSSPDSPFPLFTFMSICVLLIPALSGGLSAWALSPVTWERFASLYAADAMPMLALVPIFIVWNKGPDASSKIALPERGTMEWLGNFMILGIFASFVFFNTKLEPSPFEFPYLLFPIMGWIAMRNGLKGAALALALVTVLGIWATFYFPSALFRYHDNVGVGLISLHLYLASLLLMSFGIANLFQQRSIVALSLKRLSAKMTSALEQERKNIAYDIHDNVGQLLAALKMQITTLRDVKGHEHQRQLANSSLQILDKTLESLRAISQTLQPSLMDQVGTATALRYLVSDVEKASGIKINLSLDTVLDIGGQTAIAIYRIVQEALSNAIRHSGTSAIDVSLTRNNKKRLFSLTVRDYGSGTSNDNKGDGLGLVSMRERASTIGATFEVKTARNPGTAVEVSIPFSSLKGEQYATH